MQTVSSLFLAAIALLSGLLTGVPCHAQPSAGTVRYPQRPIKAELAKWRRVAQETRITVD